MIFEDIYVFNLFAMKKYFFFMKTALLIVLMSMFLLPSCDLSSGIDDSAEKERLLIHNFLSQNDTIDFELKPSGLYYYEHEAGTGLQAEPHDTVYVFYAMNALNTSMFETNYETPDPLLKPIGEGELIAGFDESLTYMKVGGTSLILVPSKLAYGENGNIYVPPYTPFVFQIDLVKLVKNTD